MNDSALLSAEYARLHYILETTRYELKRGIDRVMQEIDLFRSVALPDPLNDEIAQWEDISWAFRHGRNADDV